MQGGQKHPLTHLEKGKLSTVVIGMCWAFNSYLQAKRRRCAVFSFTQAGIMIGRVPFCYLSNVCLCRVFKGNALKILDTGFSKLLLRTKGYGWCLTKLTRVFIGKGNRRDLSFITYIPSHLTLFWLSECQS